MTPPASLHIGGGATATPPPPTKGPGGFIYTMTNGAGPQITLVGCTANTVAIIAGYKETYCAGSGTPISIAGPCPTLGPGDIDQWRCDQSCLGPVGKNWDPNSCGLGGDSSVQPWCLCIAPCGQSECGNPKIPDQGVTGSEINNLPKRTRVVETQVAVVTALPAGHGRFQIIMEESQVRGIDTESRLVKKKELVERDREARDVPAEYSAFEWERDLNPNEYGWITDEGL
ncbi:hypothetical protein MMC18_006300 [Xylographa bjoerkii]|nr:hypothetical protein [Xylographa bjoerkii]